MIKKEEAVASSANQKAISQLENLFGINNNYLGMFKKEDKNNSSVKVGCSLNFVDTSKVDPTLEKDRKRTVSMPYEEKFKPYTYCNKDHKDKQFTREKFLNQPMMKDVYKYPVRT